MKKPMILQVFDDHVVKAKIERVRQKLLDKAVGIDAENFTAISTADLRLLFELYYEEFFDPETRSYWQVHFSMSKRMTKTAGKVIYNRRDTICEIRIATYLLFRLDFSDPDQFYVVNGIKCYTRLDCLMRVFEHEIVHVFEYIACGNSNCSQPRFKDMVYKLFRHTETKHEMTTSKREPVPEGTFKPGDRVRFLYRGTVVEGTIRGIRKRATVLGEPVQDKSGRKLMPKYYVPLSRLIKIDRTGQA